MKFPDFSAKLAEFVGILLGDGSINVYKDHQRVKITLHAVDDKEYAKFIQRLVVELFSRRVIVKERSGEQTVDLFLFDRKIIGFLLQEVQLISSPKWGRARIPEWIFDGGYGFHVLRGYCDTDGCVVKTKNNGILYPRIEMKVSPSPMQAQFISLLKEGGFRFGVYDIGKGKVRIQLNGKEQLLLWIEKIGFSNPRKFERANSFFP